MRLDCNQIREILVVKHNCTLQDFMRHIQLLRGHFDFENTREDEVLELLKEVEQDGEFCISYGRVSKNTSVEPFILQKKRSAWAMDIAA